GSQPVNVIVRFSNFAGVPDIPDNAAMGSPRGLAVRFELPGGGSTDMVTHSFNGFPSQNADQFRDLLEAIAASGPGASKPTKLDAYLDAHPAAKHFLSTPKPNPVSYGTLPYYGVNTFKFINAKGKVMFGRYQWLPVVGGHYLDDAQSKAQAPDYLAKEIAERVKKGPVQFKLFLQLAGKDDHVDDPSITWPESRPRVELGTLSITRLNPDSAGSEKKIVFMPNSLPKGIEVEDQMVNFRSSAYAVSFGQRQ
ncbi:MAG TPA: catalase family peroxidase, partial [Terriglobia bacterium]|nr:catalase family peroxidase [Terriglobia bacterium]